MFKAIKKAWDDTRAELGRAWETIKDNTTRPLERALNPLKDFELPKIETPEEIPPLGGEEDRENEFLEAIPRISPIIVDKPSDTNNLDMLLTQRFMGRRAQRLSPGIQDLLGIQLPTIRRESL